jgi:hypothetical protein
MANALEVALPSALVRLRDRTTDAGRRWELTRLIKKSGQTIMEGVMACPHQNQNLKLRATW